MRWKPIDGYEHCYLVSDTGLIKSVARYRPSREGNIRRPTYPRGYVYVELSKNNKKSKRSVHRMVALAFIPNPMRLPEVNHLDGDKKNNRVSNLEWCTKSENQLHSFRIGRVPACVQGKRNPNAKLTELQVKEIRKRMIMEKTTHLAKEYGVTFGAIARIKNGTGWANI